MKALQERLRSYEQQQTEIVRNQASYQSVRCHTFDSWQSASCTFGYQEILAITGSEPHKGSCCFYSEFWKRGRYGQHMRDDATTQQLLRNAIVTKLSCPPDEISTALNISARGEDPTCQFGKLAYFATYTIGYQRRVQHTVEEKYFDQAKYDQAFRELEQNIQCTKDAIVVQGIQDQIRDIQTNTAQLQAQTQQTLTHIESAKHHLHAEEQKNFRLLSSLDNMQRTGILADCFDDGNATFIVDSIKSLGFDATYLAFMAAQKGHTALMNLAIENGANITSVLIEGKTVLQHAISLKHMNLVEAILQKGQEGLISSLLSAVEQGDVETVACVFAKYPNLAKEKVCGYTFFQTAVASNKFTVVQAILAADKDCASILSDSGESAFKIALRSACPDIIKLVATNADASSELTYLVQQKEFSLVDKALIVCHFDQELKQGLLRFAVDSDQTAAISVLIKNGANTEILFAEYMKANNLTAALALAMADQRLLQHLTNELSGPSADETLQQRVEIESLDEHVYGPYVNTLARLDTGCNVTTVGDDESTDV